MILIPYFFFPHNGLQNVLMLQQTDKRLLWYYVNVEKCIRRDTVRLKHNLECQKDITLKRFLMLCWSCRKLTDDYASSHDSGARFKSSLSHFPGPLLCKCFPYDVWKRFFVIASTFEKFPYNNMNSKNSYPFSFFV